MQVLRPLQLPCYVVCHGRLFLYDRDTAPEWVCVAEKRTVFRVAQHQLPVSAQLAKKIIVNSTFLKLQVLRGSLFLPSLAGPAFPSLPLV
jgi:hypothetical protein